MRSLVLVRALLVLVAACAVTAPHAPSAARPDAPTGRLAGAPASLRPGAVRYSDVPVHVAEPPPHHHHP